MGKHCLSVCSQPFQPLLNYVKKPKSLHFGDTRFLPDNSNLWFIALMAAGFMVYKCGFPLYTIIHLEIAMPQLFGLFWLMKNMWTFLSAVPRQHSNTQTTTHTSPPAVAAMSACSNHLVQLRHVFSLCTLRMMSHPQSHVLPKYSLI